MGSSKTFPPSPKELRFLGRIPLFWRLRSQDIKTIGQIAHTRLYRRGDLIFKKSASAREMFVVLEGQVKIFNPSGGRKHKTYSYLFPGEFFGEMALLDKKGRSTHALCQTDCRLLAISGSDFKKLLLSRPNLSYYLLQIMSRRLRQADEEIESLLFGKLFNRLCGLVLRLSPSSKKKYTHRELADLLGTSREPVARGLSILRRLGLARVENGSIAVNDREGLGKLAY